MSTRRQRLVGEAWRYLAVGLGATIVALLLFNLLVHGLGAFEAPLNRRPEAAYVLANLVGMMVSYRGTRSWAFRHRDTWHPDGGRTAYVLINTLTMVIPIACLWISRTWLNLDDPVSDNLSANVIGLALANATRFLLTRHLVFTIHRYDGEPAIALADEAA